MTSGDDEIRYEDIVFPPMTSGPMGPVWGVAGLDKEDEHITGQVRPDSATLKKYPARIKYANVVCFRAGRGRLLAVVLGKGRPVTITTADGHSHGPASEWESSCRCGWMHAIDPVRFRAALDDLPARRSAARVPTIDVATVERVAASNGDHVDLE